MCFGTCGSRIGLFSFGILCVLTLCGASSSADVIVWNSTIEEATIQFVQKLLASVDTSKSPCEDFHGYICNKQENSTQFVERPSEEEIFKKFIQNVDIDDQLMDAELMIKSFYESCQNARTLEHLKKSHLYHQTKGWPLIEGDASRNRDTPSWMNVVVAFHDIGVHYFFSQRVEIKSNRRTVELKASSDYKYTLRQNTHMAEQLLQNLGMSAAEARLKALDFVGLEGYRREVVGELGNGVSTSMTYAEFKAKFDNADWDFYFRRVLGKPLKDTDGVRLEDQQKLEMVFSMLSKTPSSRILNYVWIHYLLDKSTASCTDLIRSYFQPLYRYIVQSTTINKRRMAKMFSEIGSVYQSLLPNSVWIDEISNQKSKLYLGKMIHTTLNGDEELDAYYARLNLTKKNFYRNFEKIQKFTDSMKDARMTASAATSVSDLYEFFMGPMYNELLPEPLYFGSIGEAFAEKMIDGGGSSTPGSWRSSDSDEKFDEFGICLGDQNANFGLSTAIGNNLVRRILAERQTYEALRNWIAGNADVVNRIRGLLESLGHGNGNGNSKSNSNSNLNLEKLYFYISVYTHCPESNEFVNTYLKNSRDFAETFGCPNGSQLRPAKVCSVL